MAEKSIFEELFPEKTPKIEDFIDGAWNDLTRFLCLSMALKMPREELVANLEVWEKRCKAGIGVGIGVPQNLEAVAVVKNKVLNIRDVVYGR